MNFILFIIWVPRKFDSNNAIVYTHKNNKIKKGQWDIILRGLYPSQLYWIVMGRFGDRQRRTV